MEQLRALTVRIRSFFNDHWDRNRERYCHGILPGGRCHSDAGVKVEHVAISEEMHSFGIDGMSKLAKNRWETVSDCNQRMTLLVCHHESLNKSFKKGIGSETAKLDAETAADRPDADSFILKKAARL